MNIAYYVLSYFIQTINTNTHISIKNIIFLIKLIQIINSSIKNDDEWRIYVMGVMAVGSAWLSQYVCFSQMFKLNYDLFVDLCTLILLLLVGYTYCH